ncbi:zinc-dependent metalloprotease family protein [Nannocystaceae bacterium ST9]
MNPTSRELVVLSLVASAACRADDGEEEGYYAGVATPASYAEPLATCPADAPVLGIPDSSAVDRVDLTWTSNGVASYVDGYLYFVIPDDILSLLVAVEHGSEYTAINGMAIDGERLIDLPNAIGEGPFYHWPVEVASVTMPISTQTIPEGGCLALDPVVYADVGGSTGALHLVTRRGPSLDSTIDVNVFVVGDTAIAEADVMAAVTRMGEVYAGGGAATLGTVAISTLDWDDPYVDAEGAEPDELRALAIGDDPSAVNLLFVQDFNEVGTLGIAAGIPGPNGISGTAASAVMVSVDTHLDGDGQTLLTDLMGETMAHEAGHQLGLFHTSESDGLSHDPIGDTLECGVEFDLDGDGELTAEECEDSGGKNFMFWTSAEFGQFEMSEIQAMVLRDSVIARPQ